jgi:riboflavin synthase
VAGTAETHDMIEVGEAITRSAGGGERQSFTH